MFYFSQPRNQTRKLKTSQPSEKTRYNSKIFYKICPIFDNKEENVSSRSVLLTVSQIILQSFSYFEPKILILLPLCFSEMARPSLRLWRMQSVTLLIPSVTLIMLIIALLILSIIVLILLPEQSTDALANAERRQQCTLICLMFYFSQPKNQNQTSKKKKRQAERTRYNFKMFYEICPIFDNKE